MKKIVVSPKFSRAFRRYIKRNPELKPRVENVIRQIELDVSAPNLGTHPLRGKLEGLQACSCGYDCRIVFSIEPDEIVLIDIGTHDEVY
ncbi:MAG: type II toxin-antitoxin system mRNA interferase toxin, RelE/StbE family [Pseudanabaena sp. CAN_BIN31]|nr:type II toxin-antitoxin system mRNA interferase toxin, RelE/StbE family [Pseudanabaena sp. CAN_BIN31]